MAPAGNSADVSGGVQRRTRDSALIRFLLPSLSAMLAAATLFYCLFVFDASTQLFRDSDSGWHIRNGEHILSTGELPRTDPYSFSRPGEQWIAWEWGADVLMGAAHRAGGFYGSTALFSLTIAAVIWMAVKLHFAAGGDFLLTALLAIPMVTTASLHWLARPHVFGWVLLIGALLAAERAPLRFGKRHAAGIAVASALWANLHGSFFLGPVVALTYALGHALRPWIWDLDAHAENMRARWYLLAAATASAATLLNPYGWNLHAHIFAYLMDRDLTSRIAEFQSFNFFDREALQVALTVAIAAAGAVLALSQKKLPHFFLMAMLVWGGLRSARVLPLVALIALPLANGALSEALRRLNGLRPPLQRRLTAVLRYSDGLCRIESRVHGAGFLLLIAAMSFVALRAPASLRRAGFPADRFPVQAASVVANLPSGARIYAPDNFGGYLIYRFAGARKVFFDGRSDFYGVAFMKEYLKLSQARPGWYEVAAKYNFTHALVPVDSPLIAALEAKGWGVSYRDQTAVLVNRHASACGQPAAGACEQKGK